MIDSTRDKANMDTTGGSWMTVLGTTPYRLALPMHFRLIMDEIEALGVRS